MLKVINLYKFWKSNRFHIVFFLPEVHPVREPFCGSNFQRFRTTISEEVIDFNRKKTSKIISDHSGKNVGNPVD